MPDERLASRSGPLFGTHQRAILEIWDRMQRLQADFALAQELSFYHTSREWRSAKTVLDLGTGNGYYLRQIAARFPGKTYHGVDTSPELIAIAEREARGGTITFSHRNLFTVREAYDFVVMRLLLQHLDDIPAVLLHVGGLTHPGRSALIIDAHDPLRFLSPKLPTFMEFFAAYAEHERKAGRDRQVGSRIQRAIAGSTLWRPGEVLRLLIPSTIPGNLGRLVNTYTLLLDLVEQAGEFPYDYPAVREALRRWRQLPDAYMQVGLNMIRLERV